MNIMLDGLPTEYEGYLIRTDFRIGMQISEALSDVNLADPEKMTIAMELLYGRGIPPDVNIAEKGLRWFMSGGEPDAEKTSDGKTPTFDFEQDNRLVYSAFRARFGIDLTRERLHWFAFIAMLSDLGSCSLTDIIDIRGADLSQMKGEQQRRYANLKEKYAVKRQISDSELAAVSDFEDRLH